MKNARTLSLLQALLATALISSLFLWMSGYSPWTAFRTILAGSWGSAGGAMLMLSKTSLLILTGLAVALPYRAGLFNIGGEGQFLWGGMAAAIVGIGPLSALGPLHLILCLAAGCLAGSLWGWIAAVLKNRRGVNEVISTIMLNFIAFQCVNELTFGAFNAGEGASRTAFVRDSARLPVLAARGASEISSGLLLSLLLAAALSWVLYRTWFGFSIRAVGDNPTACRYAGISTPRVYRWAMLLGGGCAGLAGAIQVIGVDGAFYARFAGGCGFDGIAVAFLALCEPWAVVPAALAIASLRAADRALQLDVNLPKEMIFLLEGVLIICIAVFTRRRNSDSR